MPLKLRGLLIMALGINPNQNEWMLHKFLPMDRLNAMQTTLTYGSKSWRTHQLFNRAKHVFSFNLISAVYTIFSKYFPKDFS